MAKKTSASNFDLKSFGMPIVWGILFMFLAYILSGDASSIVIGLLVMYLEYKMRKEASDRFYKQCLIEQEL